MEQFQFKNQDASKLNAIEKLIKEGISYGLDFQNVLNKIESVKSMVKDGIVRIVLLGSFSDGKTSAIAGLLGRLMDSMKIDMDESSDELTVYRPEGLKKGFEIIDTPGLFGTKEKELDGKNVKYSDITKKYLSEAQIVIYVCDAVTPLKDSHVPVIRWIMRDLKKLDSTIFVINKMDEAGYDLTDEEEFANGTNIKRQNLISRLRTEISLTPEEEKKLHIVCIAADPKGKGLAHWFAKPDDYLRRSHIDLLKKELTNVVEHSDASDLTLSAAESSARDVLVQMSGDINQMIRPTNKALDKVQESVDDLNSDLRILRSELQSNRTDMQTQMDQYRAGLIADIKSATLQTMEETIDRTLGVQNGKVTFYVFKTNIEQIMKGAQEAAQGALGNSMVKFERDFKAQDEFLKASFKFGVSQLKNVTVTSKQVFAVRDLMFKNFKFKPWGAINMAGNITKIVGRLAGILSIGFEIYSWYKEWKANKDLDNMKSELVNALDNIFAEIYPIFNDEKNYLENFAPQYAQMKELLDNREKELATMKTQVNNLENYKEKVRNFLNKGASYVDYQEV